MDKENTGITQGAEEAIKPAVLPGTPVENKDNTVEVLSPVTPVSNDPVGEPTPSQKEVAPVVPEVKQPLPQDAVQKRIDKMYARLQKEREARIKAENTVNVQQLISKHADADDDDDDDTPAPTSRGLTEADVKRILQSEKQEAEFMSVESEVLMRHPEALNDDGTFNMNDPFCQKYIEIGKRNPILATMVDGPRLAEAQAEKELGISYQKGRLDEAQNIAAAHNAHTLSSTTRPVVPSKVVLTDQEKKIAARYKMTEEEYFESKNRKTVL